MPRDYPRNALVSLVDFTLFIPLCDEDSPLSRIEGGAKERSELRGDARR